MSHEVCCVVDQHCTNAANYYIEATRRYIPKCFRCGEFVCYKCSSLRKYRRYGRKRLCNNCQTEEDGHHLFVLRRIYHQAGYPATTFAKLRAEGYGTESRRLWR